MDKLLDLLYFSAVDEASADALPDALARFFGGHSCSVFVFDPATGQPHGRLLSNHPAELQQRYVDHYHALDPWRLPVLNKLGRAVLGAELVPEADLARSAFYNEFSREGGMFHLLAAAIPVATGRVAAITTHRAHGRNAFDAGEVERLGSLLPHFVRATQLRALFEGRLRRLEDEAVDVLLHAVGGPALVCDGAGRPLFLNAAAAAARVAAVPLVQGQPGSLSVVLPGPAMRLFLAAAADAARGGPGGVLRIPGGLVLVGPLPQGFGRLGLDPGLVLVSVKLLDADAVARQAAQLFGLSNAEAAISAAIAAGWSPEQVAERRSVKVGTVRTLVRRALEKTGCANLRQLTTLLAMLSR